MVTISDCLLTGSFEEGTLLDGTCKPFPADANIPRNGRIKFGTESNGGFKRITITNCVFDGCRGLALEAVDGAILEDISVTNISMRDIVDGPIFIRLGDRMRGPEGVPVGALRRVIINNIVCSNAASNISSLFSGLPGHPIEELKLSNILIEHRGGGTPAQATLQPPEEERERYPEPKRFGDTPSHGFFIRHVLEDVRGADFFRIKIPKTANTSTFALKAVEDFNVGQCNNVSDTHIDKAENKKL